MIPANTQFLQCSTCPILLGGENYCRWFSLKATILKLSERLQKALALGQNGFQFIFDDLWIAPLCWDNLAFAECKQLWSEPVMMAWCEWLFIQEKKQRKRCLVAGVGSFDLAQIAVSAWCVHHISSPWLFLFLTFCNKNPSNDQNTKEVIISM